MQNETGLYEIPADRLVFTHETLGASRELGEVEIVNTIWGTAKVRVIRKQDNSKLAWMLGALGALAGIAIVWYLAFTPKTETPGPHSLAMPQTTVPKTSAENAPAQNMAETPAAPVAQIPEPAAATAAPNTSHEPSKPIQLVTKNHADTAPKTPLGASRQNNRSGAADAYAQVKPVPTPPKNQPLSGRPTANAASLDHPAAQPETTGVTTNAPAASEAAMAPVKIDPPANAAPVKSELEKSDAKDSRP